MAVNVALQYPVFRPAMRQISAITNANPAVVTTTFAHNYLTGTIVRLDIAPQDGMAQANQLFGPINVLTTTTFAIAIDTTLFDQFVVTTPPKYTPSQSVPIGEINQILTAAVMNVLPFNMSP